MNLRHDEGETYVVRPYRSSDRDGFLDLYEAVWGTRKGRDWFDWRFEANPYVDEVAMVVADRGGRIVGAEPCVVFRLRAGDTTALAFQPADWMVHPDHRKRGVFTSMTDHLVDCYADGPPRLYYNFPSAAILPGLEAFDWRVVEQLTTYYRVQHPDALVRRKVASDDVSRAAATLARLSAPIVRGYLRVRDRRPGRSDDAPGVSIATRDGVPAETLTRLYARAVPDHIHAHRDADFYRWRFDNPRWATTTYVARRGGDPVAAVVACTDTRRDTRVTAVLEVLPLDGSVPDATFDALLERVVADAADSDAVKIDGDAMPTAVLRRHGFLPDDSLPFSALSTQTTMVVRPASLDEPNWTLGGRDVRDAVQWLHTLAGQDVG